MWSQTEIICQIEDEVWIAFTSTSPVDNMVSVFFCPNESFSVFPPFSNTDLDLFSPTGAHCLFTCYLICMWKAAFIFNVSRMHCALCGVYIFSLVNKIFPNLENTTFPSFCLSQQLSLRDPKHIKKYVKQLKMTTIQNINTYRIHIQYKIIRF